MVLVGGDPGIGKSTLLLQICQYIGDGSSVLYVTGEESAQQVKMRASRLGVSPKGLLLLAETNLDSIISHAANAKPDVMIVDSIQTMYRAEVASAPGSVAQVRDATHFLMRLAKENNIAIFIVGHVTKEGSIAGPRVLEHMVDCVLYFEGERQQSYRILRTVKNRFGSTDEIGVFEMKDSGLKQVKNPVGKDAVRQTRKHLRLCRGLHDGRLTPYACRNSGSLRPHQLCHSTAYGNRH